MRYIVLFILFLSSIIGSAQTGIGTTTPNASAKLDVYSDNKGFLPPRVTLTSATDNTTVPNAAEGLLVYNKGSVGLQAGYYYWNGSNWATIATATSAGNGVTAMDMVKLYGEAWSNASGKIGNSSGYTFTVPVSGRYLFDFSSSGFSSNTVVTMTFKVRQGTTDIGSDLQTSANNSSHVEYNGKIEVNLQAGISYNVYVSYGGTRDLNDYDRVYYKLVAGNLPVTGQTVDYISVSNIYQTAIGDNRDLIFTSNNGGNIPYNTSTGIFTLSANKTYLFQAQVRANTPSASGNYIEYGFVDALTNALLVNGTQTITSSTTSTGGFGSNPVINFIYTPTNNQTVKLRTTATTVGTQAIVSGTANITQIGSSAIINPWTLSGTNTYNTTGNVGIGTNSPTSTLDVTGSLAVSSATNLKGSVSVGAGSGLEGGQIDLANAASGNTTLSGNVGIDVYGDKVRIFENGGNARGVNIDLSKAPIGASGDLIWKASGKVNAGSFVQLDNIKAGPTRSGAGGGYAGLSIGAVSNTYVANVSAMYSNSTVGGQTITGTSYTTTASNSWNGWGFLPGQQSTYILNDTTNNRVYRIILMIGDSSYNNNFVSIERLY